jgi:multidrug efflux pump subunit AcrA (membrane-fusion protein)
VLNPGRLLVPGLYAQATITLEKKDDSLAVPLQAVNQQSGQTTVYIVNSANQIEVRNVVLGIQSATDAEVLSGLQEGEMVVVSDRSSLRAGEAVRPKVVELLQYQSQDGQR